MPDTPTTLPHQIAVYPETEATMLRRVTLAIPNYGWEARVDLPVNIRGMYNFYRWFGRRGFFDGVWPEWIAPDGSLQMWGAHFMRPEEALPASRVLGDLKDYLDHGYVDVPGEGASGVGRRASQLAEQATNEVFGERYLSTSEPRRPELVTLPAGAYTPEERATREAQIRQTNLRNAAAYREAMRQWEAERPFRARFAGVSEARWRGFRSLYLEDMRWVAIERLSHRWIYASGDDLLLDNSPRSLASAILRQMGNAAIDVLQQALHSPEARASYEDPNVPEESRIIQPVVEWIEGYDPKVADFVLHAVYNLLADTPYTASSGPYGERNPSTTEVARNALTFLVNFTFLPGEAINRATPEAPEAPTVSRVEVPLGFRINRGDYLVANILGRYHQPAPRLEDALEEQALQHLPPPLRPLYNALPHYRPNPGSPQVSLKRMFVMIGDTEKRVRFLYLDPSYQRYIADLYIEYQNNPTQWLQQIQGFVGENHGEVRYRVTRHKRDTTGNVLESQPLGEAFGDPWELSWGEYPDVEATDTINQGLEHGAIYGYSLRRVFVDSGSGNAYVSPPTPVVSDSTYQGYTPPGGTTLRAVVDGLTERVQGQSIQTSRFGVRLRWKAADSAYLPVRYRVTRTEDTREVPVPVEGTSATEEAWFQYGEYHLIPYVESGSRRVLGPRSDLTVPAPPGVPRLTITGSLNPFAIDGGLRTKISQQYVLAQWKVPTPDTSKIDAFEVRTRDLGPRRPTPGYSRRASTFRTQRYRLPEVQPNAPSVDPRTGTDPSSPRPLEPGRLYRSEIGNDTYFLVLAGRLSSPDHVYEIQVIPSVRKTSSVLYHLPEPLGQFADPNPATNRAATQPPPPTSPSDLSATLVKGRPGEGYDAQIAWDIPQRAIGISVLKYNSLANSNSGSPDEAASSRYACTASSFYGESPAGEPIALQDRPTPELGRREAYPIPQYGGLGQLFAVRTRAYGWGGVSDFTPDSHTPVLFVPPALPRNAALWMIRKYPGETRTIITWDPAEGAVPDTTTVEAWVVPPAGEGFRVVPPPPSREEGIQAWVAWAEQWGALPYIRRHVLAGVPTSEDPDRFRWEIPHTLTGSAREACEGNIGRLNYTQALANLKAKYDQYFNFRRNIPAGYEYTEINRADLRFRMAAERQATGIGYTGLTNLLFVIRPNFRSSSSVQNVWAYYEGALPESLDWEGVRQIPIFESSQFLGRMPGAWSTERSRLPYEGELYEVPPNLVAPFVVPSNYPDVVKEVWTQVSGNRPVPPGGWQQLEIAPPKTAPPPAASPGAGLLLLAPLLLLGLSTSGPEEPSDEG